MPCRPLEPLIHLRAFVTGGITGLDRSRVLHVRRGRGVGRVFEICVLPICGLLLNPTLHQTVRARMDTSDHPR